MQVHCCMLQIGGEWFDFDDLYSLAYLLQIVLASSIP